MASKLPKSTLNLKQVIISNIVYKHRQNKSDSQIRRLYKLTMTSTTNYKFQNYRGRYILMFIVFEVTLAVFALLAPMKAKREKKQVLNFV